MNSPDKLDINPSSNTPDKQNALLNENAEETPKWSSDPNDEAPFITVTLEGPTEIMSVTLTVQNAQTVEFISEEVTKVHLYISFVSV